MALDEQITALRTEVQTLVNQAKAAHAELERKADAASQDERNAFVKMTEAGIAKREELDRLVKLKEADDYVNQPAGQGRATLKSIGSQRPRRKTWGQIVVESEEYQDAARVDAGRQAQKRAARMDRVNVKSPIYGSTEGTGGALIQEMREEELIDIPFRPRSVLDLINMTTTDSNAVEFARIATRTNNAAPVPDFDTDLEPDNFGLKPESGMTFELLTANVRTIATWIPTHRNILRDVAGLQNLIDTQLTEMLRVEVEDQIITGDGTGQNFDGILNTAGVLTRTQGAGARSEATDSVADTIRRGMTDIVLQFYRPDGILLNPVDTESIELERATDGHYVMIWDAATNRLWRLPVYESPVITANSGLVGAWRIGATLWDRQETEIRVGEPDDYFKRNAVAILAELRAAFAVVRPQAFCALTFAA